MGKTKFPYRVVGKWGLSVSLEENINLSFVQHVIANVGSLLLFGILT